MEPSSIQALPRELLEAHQRALQDETYLEYEILQHWQIRCRYLKYEEEVKDKMRVVNRALGELFFHFKKLISKRGKNGQWSAWLRRNRINRATADRLSVRYMESLNLHPPIVDEAGSTGGGSDPQPARGELS